MAAEIRIPNGPHRGAVERVCRATLEGPGRTDPELRRSLAAHAEELWSSGRSDVEIPDYLAPFVQKVALVSYKVTDEDVDDLRESAGLSEDEILEITLAAALGCALAALETGTGLVGTG
jgi:hypothetical protein